MTRYRFDQIAENSTAKKKPEESDRYRYVGLEHLDPGTLEVTRWGAEVTPKGDKLLMKKGDVLFGRRRAYQKKVGIAPFDGIFSAHGMVLRPKADVVDPMFFPFFISSDIFLDEAIRVSVGSLSPTANWKDLRTLEFDLPSPGKQRELAGILSEAESLKGHYRKMLTTCDDVVKSQFVEMFGDPVANGKQWPVSTIKETAITYGDGPFGSNLKSSDYVDDGVRVIRLGNIQQGCFSEKDRSFVSYAKYEKLKRYECKPGEVVIATLGDPILRACIVPEFGIPSIHKADCMYYETDKRRLMPAFAMCAINHPSMLRRATVDAHGQTRGRINSTQTGNLPMILPPLALQQEFADFVAQVDKSKFKLGIYGGML